MKSDKELVAAEKYNRVVQAKLNQLGRDEEEEEPQISMSSHVNHGTSLVKRVNDHLPAVTAPRSVVPLSVVALPLMKILANYKSHSASIGYCDSNNNTNDIILNRQSALDNANACIDRRTHLDLDSPGGGAMVHCDVSALPLLPFLPRPTECAICPAHAICNDGKILACEPEYILTPHPLTMLSTLADGIITVGPKAFPPSCRPDTVRKRMIGGLAKEIEGELARGRGLVVCAGLGREDGRTGLGERFGMEEPTLKERFSARRDVSVIQ